MINVKKQLRLPVVTLFSTNQSRFPDVSGVHVETAQSEDAVPFRSANGMKSASGAGLSLEGFL
ncbi:hypothetical protein [Bacillus daqingensis]|uniref:hypothetical protein n=1 Tax=Bacillus daqingensis TaxID=872396 RepID=UPI003F857866